MRSSTSLGLLGSFVIAIAACSACSSKAASKTEGTSSSDQTDRRTAAATAASSAVPVSTSRGVGTASKALGASIWSTGFKYALGAVTYDASEHVVTIEVEIENELSESRNPFPNVWLEVDGAVTSHGGFETKSPEIPGKQKVKDRLSFADVGAWDPSKTTLVMGGAEVAQARVPMSGAGPNRTLEPASHPLTGAIVLGDAIFTLKSAELRWDEVPSFETQAPKGKAFVVVRGDFKNGSDRDLDVASSTFVLTQPDGSRAPAEVVRDLHLTRGKRAEDYYVVFEIDAKDLHASGPHVLNVSQDWGPSSTTIKAAPVTLHFD